VSIAGQFAVIVNPARILKPKEEQRRMWAQIEAEIGFRAAEANGVEIEGIMYLDLGRGELQRFKQPKQRIWAEIKATCERIFRDWRDIRLEIQAKGQETG
jgi:hypothetical protein